MRRNFFLGMFFFPLILFSQASQRIGNMSFLEVRDRINQKILSIPAESFPVHEIRDLHISHNGRTTLLRVYIPNEHKNLPAALLIHGGGWVAGNLDTHDNMARDICQKAQILVVSVGYTNSPEGKFPLPLEQCYDALSWIAQHAKEYHADASRLAVIGDSSGGTMATALCLLARDRSGPPIELQILINPSPDLTEEGKFQQHREIKEIMGYFIAQYIEKKEDVYNPYVSPIMASDLRGLPSALIILAESDELREDGEKYADRLRAAAVPTTVYVQSGIGHLAGEGARASKRAQDSLNCAVKALSQSLHTSLKE